MKLWCAVSCVNCAHRSGRRAELALDEKGFWQDPHFQDGQFIDEMVRLPTLERPARTRSTKTTRGGWLMRNQRRSRAILALVAVGMLALTACSGGESTRGSSGTSGASSAEKVTLTVWHYYNTEGQV